MMLRTATCDVPNCKESTQEETEGAGWPGWGQLHGIKVIDRPNPWICPKHMAKVADFICAQEHNGNLD